MVHVEGKDDRMVANNLEPHYLTHPGEVIKDELAYRGISQRCLANQIGVPASQLNELLNAKRPLNAEMALLIEQALGIDAAPLLSLQMKYNLLSAKRLFQITSQKAKKITILMPNPRLLLTPW